MKKLLILLACFTLLFAIGCSDDDDDNQTIPTIPTAETVYEGFVHGSFYLDGGALYADELMVLGFGAIPPNLDSVVVGDSVLAGYDYFDYDYDEDYHENWWEIYMNEDGPNYMFDHGDMATATFYGEGKSSSVTFRILNADSAEANIISPEYDTDTLADGESLTVVWSKVQHAENYSIWIEFSHGATDEYDYHYTYTSDTTITISADIIPDDLMYMYVSVTPFTGPDPETGKGNMTGNFLTGKVYSFGWDEYTYVEGWYTPPVSVSKRAPRTKVHPTKIIENTYEFLNK